MADERADALEQLARIMRELETQEVKQRAKARMELEWQGKQTARAPQQEPEGLFAHKQERLF